MGGNVGDAAAYLRSGARALASLGVVEARSGLYRTAPVGGPPDQAAYLNAVVALRPWPTFRDPRILLAGLLEVERLHGRVRRTRWEARTLDLDLLDLSGMCVHAPDLALPHPRMMDRAFVLAPLCEAAPAWRHPATGEPACAALERVGTAGVARTELTWTPR